MALYYAGDSTRASWITESGTYGTISGASQQWIGRVEDATASESQGYFVQRYVGGGTRGVNAIVPGPTENKPKIKFMPQDWKLLVYAFGKTVDANVSGTSQHTLTTLNSTGTWPSFAIEQSKVGGNTTISTTYRGCVVDSATIEGKQGEPFRVTLDLIAQNASGGTSSTAVTSGTKVPYLWSDGKGLNVSGTALGLNGYITELKDISLKIANNQLADRYIQETRDIRRPIPQAFDFTVDATLNMTEATGAQFVNTFRNGSTINLDFYITRTGSAFTPTGAGGSWDFVQFWASGVTVETESDTYVPEGPTEQKVSFHAISAGANVGDANANYTTFF